MNDFMQKISTIANEYELNPKKIEEIIESKDSDLIFKLLLRISRDNKNREIFDDLVKIYESVNSEYDFFAEVPMDLAVLYYNRYSDVDRAKYYLKKSEESSDNFDPEDYLVLIKNIYKMLGDKEWCTRLTEKMSKIIISTEYTDIIYYAEALAFTDPQKSQKIMEGLEARKDELPIAMSLITHYISKYKDTIKAYPILRDVCDDLDQRQRDLIKQALKENIRNESEKILAQREFKRVETKEYYECIRKLDDYDTSEFEAIFLWDGKEDSLNVIIERIEKEFDIYVYQEKDETLSVASLTEVSFNQPFFKIEIGGAILINKHGSLDMLTKEELQAFKR